MNKRNYVLGLLIFLVLLVSACSRSGASSGKAPKTPFIGGTTGITINFEKDSPPPEVTDDGSFAFDAFIRIKNDGEFKVLKDKVRINLVGFDPVDFQSTLADISDIIPDDDMDSKKRDAEGSIVEGTTTFAKIPKGGPTKDFIPKKFPGNTELTFRADICYNYNTDANTKLCVLRDMINARDDMLCKPTGSRQIYSSSAPVQILNFKQDVVGKDKISFSFDIVLSNNVDIFWNEVEKTPSDGFEAACPRTPKNRRQVENNVGLEILSIPTDALFSNLKCGGLDGAFKGVIKLINGRRTITCTADISATRNDLEKIIPINLKYNVLDNKETKVVVKHFITS